MKSKKTFWIIVGCGISVLLLILALSPDDSSSSEPAAVKAAALDVAPNMSEVQLKSAASHMRAVPDDVKECTFYYHSADPYYNNSSTRIRVYFGKANGTSAPWTPNIIVQYVSEDWLFIEKITVKTDSNTYTLSGKVNRDSGERINGDVGIWEWINEAVTGYTARMLLDISSSKKTIVRFEGRQYYNDYVVPESNKQTIREMLAAWKYSGGDVPSSW